MELSAFGFENLGNVIYKLNNKYNEKKIQLT